VALIAALSIRQSPSYLESVRPMTTIWFSALDSKLTSNDPFLPRGRGLLPSLDLKQIKRS
jgi:hypothetical protein